MVKPICDRLWEVDAMREGRLSNADAGSHDRHRAGCAICAERYERDMRLAALGRALPEPARDGLELRRLRAQVLKHAAAAPKATSPRARVTLAVALAAIVVVLGVVVGRRPALDRSATQQATTEADTFASTVSAHEGAIWSRRREAKTERVVLERGTIVVQVRKQVPGEHFVVELPDGAIEVRGTWFEVTVDGGVTTSVRVFDGVVALRRSGSGERELRAYESWTLEQPATPSITTTGAPPTARGPRAPASPPVDGSDVSAEYDAAMAAYRAQSWSDSARRFSAFAAKHPHAPESEDAAFLEAAALAHAGRSDAALAAERFLSRYPKSFHARDASILVARAARDRGDCDRARSVLAPWHGTEITTALGACAPE